MRRHDGRWFVYRRAARSWVERQVRAPRAPDGYEAISADAACALVTGARVHRPTPTLAVLDVPGGVIMGAQGHIGIDPTRIVPELGPGWLSDAEVLRESATAAAGPVVELPGTTANLAAVASKNYCHWLLQGCTRLELLDLIGTIPACDQYFVMHKPPPFVLETLDRYGIEPARIVAATDHPEMYRCERLLAPGMARNEADTPRWVLDQLRERFKPDPSPLAPTRIYIGRGSAGRRIVLNEQDVLDEVTARGFEAVTMDGRTVSEQAALLSRAECVIAPHGAALTNLVFAPPGATIIELANHNWPHRAFRGIAATMGFAYIAVLGAEARAPSWFGKQWVIDADSIVDVERLARTLDGAGLT